MQLFYAFHRKKIHKQSFFRVLRFALCEKKVVDLQS
jgi:hypothetical protein